MRGRGFEEFVCCGVVRADAAGVKRGGDDGLAVAVGGRSVSQRWIRAGPAARTWVNPASVGVERDPDALVGAGEGFAAAPFGLAECLGYLDNPGHVEQRTVVDIWVGLTRGRLLCADVVLVGPQ